MSERLNQQREDPTRRGIAVDLGKAVALVAGGIAAVRLVFKRRELARRERLRAEANADMDRRVREWKRKTVGRV